MVGLIVGDGDFSPSCDSCDIVDVHVTTLASNGCTILGLVDDARPLVVVPYLFIGRRRDWLIVSSRPSHIVAILVFCNSIHLIRIVTMMLRLPLVVVNSTLGVTGLAGLDLVKPNDILGGKWIGSN